MNSDSNNSKYILFMVVSMAGFAIEDAVIKQLAIDLPISQVLMLIGLTGGGMFWVMARLRSVHLLHASMATRKFVVRSFCELGAAISFVTAIVYASLGASSAILQATPLAVALGGMLFLKQSVSARQWFVILIGFCGVILIIQPGMQGFHPASLLAVLSVLFLATRDLITRSIASSIDPIAISFWSFFALFVAGIVTIPLYGTFGPVQSSHAGLLVLSMIAGTGAYLAVVMATRGGDVAVVAPFRYSRLVFAMVLAVVFFDEAITWPIIAGSALIVGSGLLTLRAG